MKKDLNPRILLQCLRGLEPEVDFGQTPVSNWGMLCDFVAYFKGHSDSGYAAPFHPEYLPGGGSALGGGGAGKGPDAQEEGLNTWRQEVKNLLQNVTALLERRDLAELLSWLKAYDSLVGEARVNAIKDGFESGNNSEYLVKFMRLLFPKFVDNSVFLCENDFSNNDLTFWGSKHEGRMRRNFECVAKYRGSKSDKEDADEEAMRGAAKRSQKKYKRSKTMLKRQTQTVMAVYGDLLAHYLVSELLVPNSFCVGYLNSVSSLRQEIIDFIYDNLGPVCNNSDELYSSFAGKFSILHTMGVVLKALELVSRAVREKADLAALITDKVKSFNDNPVYPWQIITVEYFSDCDTSEKANARHTQLAGYRVLFNNSCRSYCPDPLSQSWLNFQKLVFSTEKASRFEKTLHIINGFTLEIRKAFQAGFFQYRCQSEVFEVIEVLAKQRMLLMNKNNVAARNVLSGFTVEFYENAFRRTGLYLFEKNREGGVKNFSLQIEHFMGAYGKEERRGYYDYCPCCWSSHPGAAASRHAMDEGGVTFASLLTAIFFSGKTQDQISRLRMAVGLLVYSSNDKVFTPPMDSAMIEAIAFNPNMALELAYACRQLALSSSSLKYKEDIDRSSDWYDASEIDDHGWKVRQKTCLTSGLRRELLPFLLSSSEPIVMATAFGEALQKLRDLGYDVTGDSRRVIVAMAIILEAQGSERVYDAKAAEIILRKRSLLREKCSGKAATPYSELFYEEKGYLKRGVLKPGWQHLIRTKYQDLDAMVVTLKDELDKIESLLSKSADEIPALTSYLKSVKGRQMQTDEGIKKQMSVASTRLVEALKVSFKTALETYLKDESCPISLELIDEFSLTCTGLGWYCSEQLDRWVERVGIDPLTRAHVTLGDYFTPKQIVDNVATHTAAVRLERFQTIAGNAFSQETDKKAWATRVLKQLFGLLKMEEASQIKFTGEVKSNSGGVAEAFISYLEGLPMDKLEEISGFVGAKSPFLAAMASLSRLILDAKKNSAYGMDILLNPFMRVEEVSVAAAGRGGLFGHEGCAGRGPGGGGKENRFF